MYLFYTWDYIGGVKVNEFEKDVQSKNNDVVDSIKGFAFSFIFFVLIFAIGAAINVVGS
ncbi:YqzM-like protein [Lentibacillus halodurans]|uniref:YqzM-like protein n=1 Tax=Lentibacillus halodurans TaxID=237679 RepID=A0A1I0V105_9BACI|nr:YqzM-like protein [Lentibacillus halodurans]